MSRTSTGLAAHTLLRLQMTLVKGDSFDNEYLFVEVDGTVVYSSQESGGQGTQEYEMGLTTCLLICAGLSVVFACKHGIHAWVTDAATAKTLRARACTPWTS